MMLLAGIMWAYIIGGLVGVASKLERTNDIYGARLDQAGELIRDFENGDDDPDSLKRTLSKRIKMYIHTQHFRSQSPASMNGLFQAYPVLESLTPEMQRISSLLLMRKYLESVPYLSSKYLTPEEQSAVALQCVYVDFAAGETAEPRQGINHLGVGIIIIHSGVAVFRGELGKRTRGAWFNFLTSGMAFGTNAVLLEDVTYQKKESELNFLTFTKVVFIPRKAILDALENSKTAWKACARWKYLISLLLSERIAQYERQSWAAREMKKSIADTSL